MFLSYESWKDLRYIPLYACGVSLVLLLLFTITLLPAVKAKLSGYRAAGPKQSEELSPDENSSEARAHVYSRGGPAIYAFHILRLLGCIALAALSLTAILLSKSNTTAKNRAALDREEWPQIAVTVAYIYAALMSIFTILPRSGFRAMFDAQATFVLLVQFVVFAWRNFFPLTMFGGIPADPFVPWILWTSGALVTIIGFLSPLLIPRVYSPVDPTDPSSIPSPEQTASILSFLTFSFLEPIVFLAYRLPRLPYDRLPPLPDYDWAKNLAARSLDKLDPLRRRQSGLKEQHLFFGLLQVFGWQYVGMAVAVVVAGLLKFVGPIAVNRLLVYFETGGEGAVYRPWVWVVLLFVGTVMQTLIMNIFLFLAGHVIVQVESIVIQLVFERSLKIRAFDNPAVAQTATPTVPDPDLDAVSHDPALITDPTVDGSSPPTEASSTAASTSQQTSAEDGKTQDTGPHLPELAGRINTIIGADLPALLSGGFWVYALEIPLGVALSAWYLYELLGYAAVLGMAVTILSLPLPGLVARLESKVQKERMEKTQVRVQSVTETMSMLRMAKMFAWEAKVEDDIAEKRRAELACIRKALLLDLVNMNLVFIIPIVTMLVTFAFYTVVLKKSLDASRLFPSIVVFDILREDLMYAFGWLSGIIRAGVSLGRINDFMNKTSLLDKYAEAKPDLSSSPVNDEIVGFHQATFTWMDDAHGAQTPGTRNFRLHVDDLIFKPDAINLIVGPTGCGKTSILLALLGEMHFQPSTPASWFCLPRLHGVSYAAQEPWVQNETIKKNILFDEPYDSERYKKVLYQCALEPDLALFEAGDETEVGEKGLTLSGGQKARVTLARAVYSRARIVLLDDVLSALDVHTSRWIVEKCFTGDIIKGRTVLLVTHNVAIAAPVSQNVISLDRNGRVVSQGPVVEVLSKDPLSHVELKETALTAETAKEVDTLEGNPQSKAADGKLVLAEELAEGRLSWSPAKFYLEGFGGVLFWFTCILGYILVGFGSVIATWWLGVWASAYDGTTITVNVPYYLTIYVMIMAGRTVVNAFSYIIYTFASLEACRKVHQRLCRSVLHATLRWLDTTPTGRIISRFTQDMREVDVILPFELQDLLRKTTSMLMQLVAVIVISPTFMIPSIVLAIAGIFIGNIYIGAQLAVKREKSNWRSPLYNHFSASAAGAVSIRAFAAEDSFRSELLLRLDGYARPSRTYNNMNRWIFVRADVLGAIFSASLAAYLLYVNHGVGASNTGFSLNMAVSFSQLILWWVVTLNEVEVAGNSVERIFSYVQTEQEPPATESGKPPAYWPSSGSLQVENLFARYSIDGPVVLSDISFQIKSGERVAIVGRTGSGKSSLAFALLRMIPCSGIVYFDGLPTHGLNLDDLRTNLTIIPQDPMLISGTLRSNLDLFSEYDDAVLNDALRAAGLFRLQDNDDENKITLDSQVASGGSNFSVGQRQIIALARAIVRGAKILILDEATASVDAETDNVIQASIREQLKHSTLITIAHRLQTISDYDKVIVLDGGKLVEMDSPIALLEKGGFFCSLVEQSGDREKLWEMARNRRVFSSGSQAT